MGEFEDPVIVAQSSVPKMGEALPALVTPTLGAFRCMADTLEDELKLPGLADAIVKAARGGPSMNAFANIVRAAVLQARAQGATW
jgi:hypothetical protein